MVAYALNVVESIDTCEEPSTYEEAVSFEDSSRWMITMQVEMESLHKNGYLGLGETSQEEESSLLQMGIQKK